MFVATPAVVGGRPRVDLLLLEDVLTFFFTFVLTQGI